MPNAHEHYATFRSWVVFKKKERPGLKSMGGLRDGTPRLGVAQGTKATLSLAFWYACEQTELWEGVQCYQWAMTWHT